MGSEKSSTAKDKKTTAAQRKKGPAGSCSSTENAEIASSKELKEFLLSVRDHMEDSQAAAINVVSAMNYVLSIPNIEELLNKESKEVARDIWLRIKQAGIQLRNPPLLFDAEEEVFAGAA